MFREVEFISPYTPGYGRTGFVGRFHIRARWQELAWREALTRVQFGGERGYGWGDVGLIRPIDKVKDDVLFGGKVKSDGSADRYVFLCLLQNLC